MPFWRPGLLKEALRRQVLVAELVAITEVPAPTFDEARRGAFLLDRLTRLGAPAALRPSGNVTATFGPEGAPMVLVSAHQDTVFPDKDISVTESRTRLCAPGVGDDSAGLAALVFLAKLLVDPRRPLQKRVRLVANVGEEGLGNLKGIRRAVDAARADGLEAVVSLDGHLGAIVHGAIASRRLAVDVSGPGGHSWGDFGRPSAVHVLCELAADLARLRLPTSPQASLNIGVIEGGTSVNTIAAQARFLLDMRSAEPDALAALASRVQAAIDTPRRLAATARVVGDRPGGSIDTLHPLVRAARRALEAQHLRPQLAWGSTDANYPLSVGIPAIAAGTSLGGGAHTRQEFIEIASLATGARFAARLLDELAV